MRNRQEEIRSKGFDIASSGRRVIYEGPERAGERMLDYGSIKVNNTKILDDAVLNLGSIPKVHKQYGNKHFILKAILREYFLTSFYLHLSAVML